MSMSEIRMAAQCLSCYQLVSFIDMPTVRLDLAVQVHGKRLSAMYYAMYRANFWGEVEQKNEGVCDLHEG